MKIIFLSTGWEDYLFWQQTELGNPEKNQRVDQRVHEDTI